MMTSNNEKLTRLSPKKIRKFFYYCYTSVFYPMAKNIFTWAFVLLMPLVSRSQLNIYSQTEYNFQFGDHAVEKELSKYSSLKDELKNSHDGIQDLVSYRLKSGFPEITSLDCQTYSCNGLVKLDHNKTPKLSFTTSK